jgi:hypothetical protein
VTSISPTSSYAPGYAAILANAQQKAAATAASAYSSNGQSSATTITLSEAAKAALALKDFVTVIADARATMDKVLTDAKLTSPLKDGALAVDLSKVDRRELYAMSINAEQKFSVDEQKAAAIELQSRFDQAMAGPTAVGRVTGKIDGLYTAALAYYDAMGPEEKATASYADARAALVSMIDKLKSDPGTLPGAVSNDPIAGYMERLAAGETDGLRDIIDVGSDARATLDAQYEAGAATASYDDFDSRSLASVALNTSGDFTDAEVRTAKSEMRARSGAALLAGLKSAGSSTDPAAFAQNVISLYGAMSPEERAAAGWSDNLYQAAVSSYQSATKLASIIGSATGSSMWGGSSEESSGGDKMSLMSYL